MPKTVVIAARVNPKLAEQAARLAELRQVDKQDVIIVALEREIATSPVADAALKLKYAAITQEQPA